MRAITTVGFGKRQDVGKKNEEQLLGSSFTEKLGRWASSFALYSSDARLVTFNDVLPTGSPTHQDRPYAFKVYAIKDALRMGATRVLWTDASVVAIKSLEPLWNLIERQGYWFSDNGEWNCGEWTCDSALEPLGITREEAFRIPQIAATAFGLDLRQEIGRAFLTELEYLSKTSAFCGPWVNFNGEASPDKRVLGHRHDQTAASVIVWRMGLKMTKQPDFFSDYRSENGSTILKVQR